MTRLLVLLCLLPAAYGDNLIAILGQELDRNLAVMRDKADPKPYFLAYEVTDQEREGIACSLGAVTGRGKARNRFLDVTVRVGSPKLDNYHVLHGELPRFTSGAAVPIEDVPIAIRQRVWLDTDRAYRAAAQRFIQIQSDSGINVAAEDQSDDFSPAPAVVHEQAPPRLRVDEALWTERLRKASARLGAAPGVLASSVALTAEREIRYLVNSEGTRLEHGRIYARIAIAAYGKAADGMDLNASRTFEADTPSQLPGEDAILAATSAVSDEIAGLLKAPTVEPFTGPAILSGRAAAVFFHEIFGHRVEGHRQKNEQEGQTFTKSVGKSVLPDFLSVIFDPSRESIGGTDLFGSYSYDDEGVKAAPVTLVDAGILKTFLLSRSPIRNFPASNGHGRRQPGYEVVSRQSNLIVKSNQGVSDAKLREMLIAEIKRQGKPYGLYFADITGGYTLTGRRGLQAYSVIPLIVYRVYPDGRPDELVRGVSIVGTPLASFARILETSDKEEVFNGYCGAESGSVPVSAVSPALLIGEIEVQKKERSEDRPPILPPPSAPEGGKP